MTELDRISKLINKSQLKSMFIIDDAGNKTLYRMVNDKLTFLTSSYNEVIEMTYDGNYMGGVIPQNNFIWEERLLIVTRKANIHDHKNYISILNEAFKPSDSFMGYRFTIDGEIVERDVPHRRVRPLTLYYLKARKDRDHQINLNRKTDDLPSLYGYKNLVVTSADGKTTQYTGDKFPNLKKLKV